MKEGPTTIQHPPHVFPIVEVGYECGVRVIFGDITFVLNAPPSHDGRVVIVRAESNKPNSPIESRGAEDVKNQVEYRIREATAPSG